MSSTANEKASSPENTMQNKTWKYVGAAAACLVITGVTEFASRPQAIREYGNVGVEFYPEFTDPTSASALSVSVIDAEQVKPLEFSVKQAANGRWVIPSHHDYPADAVDQLAKTAASVIGIKRGAMVTRWESDHARYGVVDPQTESVEIDQLDGIGKRLTLRGQDDSVLCSYIIGKQIEGQSGQYYVRHPAEDETYIADLDINLSTKFGDWVETEILDISDFDVRKVVLNDYSFEERGPQLAVSNTVVSTLSRESSSADWAMEGIDEATQEVDSEKVKATIDSIADLELVGVRPKQPGLTADLVLDRTALKSQRDLDRMQSDLLSRGFILQPSEENKEDLRLIAREGELAIGTEDGLSYKLHFGRVFTGSTEELEIGFGDGAAKNTKGDEEKSEQTEKSDPDVKTDEPLEKEEEEADPNSKPGRYVFVRVEFDRSLLGDELSKPTEPTKSDALIAAEEKEKEGKEKEKEEKEKGEEKGDTKTEDGDNEDGDNEDGKTGEEEETDEEKLQELKAEFAAAELKYKDDVRELEEYEGKVKSATDKAIELNRRFAQWYYVIPGDSYDKLTLTRNDFVKAKEKEEGEDEVSVEDALKMDLPKSSPTPLIPTDKVPTTDAKSLKEPEPKPADESADKPKMKREGSETSSEESAEKPASNSEEKPKSEDNPEAKEKPKDEPKQDAKTDPDSKDGEAKKSKEAESKEAEPKDAEVKDSASEEE